MASHTCPSRFSPLSLSPKKRAVTPLQALIHTCYLHPFYTTSSQVIVVAFIGPGGFFLPFGDIGKVDAEFIMKLHPHTVLVPKGTEVAFQQAFILAKTLKGDAVGPIPVVVGLVKIWDAIPHAFSDAFLADINFQDLHFCHPAEFITCQAAGTSRPMSLPDLLSEVMRDRPSSIVVADMMASTTAPLELQGLCNQ